MSYYCNFILSVYETDNKTSQYDIIKWCIQRRYMNSDFLCPFEKSMNAELLIVNDDLKFIYNFAWYSDEKWMWYDYDEQMLELSCQFPDVIFKLHVDGEDGRTWDEYYKNSKQTRYFPVIPPLNPEDLK